MKEKNIEEKIAQINEKISRLDSKVERVKEEGRKILEDKKTSKPERKSAKKKKRVEEERELFYSQIYEYYKSGLDPEEIAKLTNMSVSEIELILELKEDG
jgi:septal ring factor EnvC (AmiA/AmiB activator)